MERIGEVQVWTGPAVKSNPQNSLVVASEPVRTAKEFVIEYLKHDKALDTYRQHLNLSSKI